MLNDLLAIHFRLTQWKMDVEHNADQEHMEMLNGHINKVSNMILCVQEAPNFIEEMENAYQD